jgi:hypothetical protein
MSFDAYKFYEDSSTFILYFYMVLFPIATLFALVALEVMRRTQGCHNLTLILLLLFIIVFSITMFFCYYKIYKQKMAYIAILDSVALAAENFCHWIITETYVVISFQTRMLVNNNTYGNLAA